MNESSDDSTFRALHRLVEHYTPDGTFGRGLLGGTALFTSPVLFFGGMSMFSGAMSFPAFLTGVVGFLLSFPAFLLGVLTLWPVYLSLIGNVESPAAYPDGTTAPDARRDRGEDPEAVLKRRYAAGELTREEFERRLDDVMEASESGDGRPTRTDKDDERRRRERARNR